MGAVVTFGADLSLRRLRHMGMVLFGGAASPRAGRGVCGVLTHECHTIEFYQGQKTFSDGGVIPSEKLFRRVALRPALTKLEAVAASR